MKFFQKKEMEANHYETGESHLADAIPATEAAALEIIRTETVLSRMPVHNLAKQGSVNIQIIKKTATGEVELKWEVSYSERYGQARQLAYKLDTIIVNQRIDEAGRPLPKILRIGSLNEICADLNLATHAGQNTKDLKRAFLQNASAFINAKFKYTANDGTERHVEAGITRYGVIFTGEKLPDGRKADAVYIVFNDPFWEVLNNAPVRPLDRAYMKELPPAAQRFYEIVSRKMFAALKNNYPHAKISYSEYCTFSAQLRHSERQRVQDQMAKLLRHHKKSGYIIGVRYEPSIDAEDRPDWILYLTPGPRARAEFAAAHRTRRIATRSELIDAGERQPRRRLAGPRPRQTIQSLVAPQTFDPQLVAEFTRRGITEQKAVELLSKLQLGQDVIAQLESAEQTIKTLQNTPHPVRNPAGFYIHLIERNTPVPDGFETNGSRKAREEKERKERERRATEDAREELEWEYNRYCAAEVDRYIQANPAEFESLKNAKAAEERALRPTSWSGLTETSAKIAAKSAIQQKLPLLTFEEFASNQKQGTDFSLKPVSVSPDVELRPEDLQPELSNPDSGSKLLMMETELAIEKLPHGAAEVNDTAPEAVPVAPAPGEIIIEQPGPSVIVTPPAASEDRGEVIQVSPESPTPPTSEPTIELAAEPMEVEPGSDATGTPLV
jgi:hypothetical protein